MKLYFYRNNAQQQLVTQLSGNGSITPDLSSSSPLPEADLDFLVLETLSGIRDIVDKYVSYVYILFIDQLTQQTCFVRPSVPTF